MLSKIGLEGDGGQERLEATGIEKGQRQKEVTMRRKGATEICREGNVDLGKARRR